MLSRSAYETQEREARAVGDALGHALRHLADLDRTSGAGDAALARATEAIDLYRDLRRPLDLANALRQRALASEAIGQTGAADWREA